MNLDKLIEDLESETAKIGDKPLFKLGTTSAEMKSSEGVINNVVSFGSVDMTRMTIRDEFACAVLNGMFAAKTFQSAELCYKIADQMMEARNRYIPPPPITAVHGQTQDPLAPIEYR